MIKRRSGLQDSIAAGILDAAAAVLAERGEGASMAEIAAAAGVGRATLYRYFPTREALLHGLHEAAFEDLCARIDEAELDTVDARKGIARLARIFITAGTKYTALFTPGREDLRREDVDRHINEPVQAMIRRGIADGTLRGDLPPQALPAMLQGLVQQGLELVLRKELGVDQAIDLVVSVFLSGTGNVDQRRR